MGCVFILSRLLPRQSSPPDCTFSSLPDMAAEEIPPDVRQIVGSYIASAHLLGQRTAEMHLALSTPTDNPDFIAEPFSSLYQRSLLQSMRNRVSETFDLLRTALTNLPQVSQEEAQALLGYKEQLIEQYKSILSQQITALRTRCHGDFHLGAGALHRG